MTNTEEFISYGEYVDRRPSELRKDLYRAIYAGDMEKAEDIINMMAMVDIDRDLIWKAKSEVRPTKPGGDVK